MQFSGIKYGVITGAAAGEGANNHTCMTFHTWGNSIWNSVAQQICNFQELNMEL